MSKYHINPKTGRVNICNANVRDCPIGGEHFTVKEEAIQHIADEASRNNPTLTTLSKELKKNIEEKNRLDAIDKEIQRMTNSDYDGLYRGELDSLANELSHIYGSRKNWRFNEETVEVLKTLKQRKNTRINDIMNKLEAATGNSNSEYKEYKHEYLKASIDNYLKRVDNGGAVTVNYENTIEELAPVGTRLKDNKTNSVYKVYKFDGECLYMANKLGDIEVVGADEINSLFNKYSIEYKPEMSSESINSFKTLAPRGSLIEVKQLKRVDDKESLKKRFFGKLYDSSKEDDEKNRGERVKIVENDGSAIKFEYLEGDKNGQVEELLREDFKEKFNISKSIYVSQYKSQKQIADEVKRTFINGTRVDLYSNIGDGIVKGVVTNNNSGGKVIITDDSGSRMSIPHKELDGYGEWSYVIKDKQNDYTGEKYNNYRMNHTHRNALPKIKANPYTGLTTVDVKDISENYIPISAKKFAEAKLSPNDTIVVIDSEGYVYSEYAKVISKDNNEFAFQNLLKNDSQPVFLSNDFIERNNMTVYKMM